MALHNRANYSRVFSVKDTDIGILVWEFYIKSGLVSE